MTVNSLLLKVYDPLTDLAKYASQCVGIKTSTHIRYSGISQGSLTKYQDVASVNEIPPCHWKTWIIQEMAEKSSIRGHWCFNVVSLQCFCLFDRMNCCLKCSPVAILLYVFHPHVSNIWQSWYIILVSAMMKEQLLVILVNVSHLPGNFEFL